jgi:predicted enzyme related to lactoylglutathione lyase
MASADVRGRFVWHELMTTDPKAAASFYTRVTGWKTQAWDQSPDYTMFTANGAPMAGYMRLPADAKAMGAPPSWLSYIGTPDLDRTLGLARELGATILKGATEIPTVGRFAVVQDPQGAVFAPFTPAGSEMGGGEPKIGDFSWHELATTDWQAALSFYQRLFGWEKSTAMDMGAGGTYQMYGWKNRMLGGMYNKPATVQGPATWLPYILVADTKRAAATAQKLGATIINGPMEVPGGGWIAQGIDPQGAMFAVHSTAPAATGAPKKKAAKKAARKKVAKKSTKKAARKAVSRKPSRSAARKGAKKATRKAARKATRRPRAAKKSAARKKAGARRRSGGARKKKR